MIGVTGVEIAPALHLHFVADSLFGKFCCCGKDDPKRHESDVAYYVDRDLKARRWSDKRGRDGIAATHARLKMLVIQRLVPITRNPFREAENAFNCASLSWDDPFMLYKEDLDRLSDCVNKIKNDILNAPI